MCKSEVESMGRIAAGILRVLKLEGSIGPAAINQLSNLGNFNNFFYLKGFCLSLFKSDLNLDILENASNMPGLVQ